MQPVKKLKTHEKVLPFQQQAFSADKGQWPNLHNFQLLFHEPVQFT